MSRIRERILVVEDDADGAWILRQQLQAVGFEVSVAGTGAAALCEAAERQPNLVILDVRLPDLSGFEVCRELRKLYPGWDLPVLMLTGLDEPVSQLRGFAHGADAYLTKPYDLTELLRTAMLLLGETAAR